MVRWKKSTKTPLRKNEAIVSEETDIEAALQGLHNHIYSEPEENPDLWAFPYWMDAWERESPMVQRGFREAHMKLTKDTRFRYSICRSCGFVRNDGLWKSAAMRINEKACVQCSEPEMRVVNRAPFNLAQPLLDAFKELLEEEIPPVSNDTETDTSEQLIFHYEPSDEALVAELEKSEELLKHLTKLVCWEHEESVDIDSDEHLLNRITELLMNRK